MQIIDKKIKLKNKVIHISRNQLIFQNIENMNVFYEKNNSLIIFLKIESISRRIVPISFFIPECQTLMPFEKHHIVSFVKWAYDLLKIEDRDSSLCFAKSKFSIYNRAYFSNHMFWRWIIFFFFFFVYARERDLKMIEDD